VAEFAERSHAAPPAVAHAAMAPAAGPLGNAPRVQRLVQRAAALNAGQAPIQLNGKDGDKKKSNNKKQEKQKAATAGKKKAKEKKISKIKTSMKGYNQSDLTDAELDAEIRGGKLSKMRAGHLSKNKTKKMNSGTVKTLADLTKSAKDKRANAVKQDESDDDYEEADAAEYDDVDYEDTGYKPPRKDDDGSAGGAAGLGGGDGITA
jgi:hypothetical protein